jgi:tripartite-type tricarboxylate transporter receptor subunit TctC
MKKLFIAFLGVYLLVYMVTGENKGQAAEKKYPVKPITFISPVEAGGGADVQARPLVEKLSVLLGQPVMVVNKPGAGSSIANRAIHDAKPDGYTIGNGTASIVSNKLMGLLPYDYRDFTILGAFLDAVPIVLAATKTQRPFKTLEEVITFTKANPGEVSVASGGKGQTWWIGAMEFQNITGVKFTIIPQEGAGGFSIAQVAGGHTDLGVLGLAEGKPQIDAGNVRFLATFGGRRPFAYPNVPTLKELGYDVKLSSLNVVMGPPNMPKDVVDILVKAVEVGAKDPDYKKFLEERNNTMSIYLTPEQALRQYDEQRKVFRDILEKTGLLKEK